MKLKVNSVYDVAIIGGGPVGIYASIKLAKSGLNALVIEEDAKIGKPRFCTGLISKEAFDEFMLPEEAIEGEFHSASVFSPSGSRLCLKSKMPVYVTDRTVFDQSLYRQAKDAGVKFLLNCRCAELKINDDCVEESILSDGREIRIKSQVAILATGIKYNLHKNIGLTVPVSFLDCSQAQVSGKVSSEIEIFIGNNVAPHSFAWTVPLKGNKLRVGVSTYQNSPFFLKSLLKNLKTKWHITEENPGIVRRPIPLGTIKNTYAERILIVGDAAGQVKPTTGGGIYFGLLCADLAAKTIFDAFKKSDFSKKFFRNYEIHWKKKIDFDLTMGLYLRKLITYFKDKQLDELIEFCAQEPIRKIIEKYGDFNHHGRFIKELIKRPIFWKNLHRILTI